MKRKRINYTTILVFAIIVVLLFTIAYTMILQPPPEENPSLRIHTPRDSYTRNDKVTIDVLLTNPRNGHLSYQSPVNLWIYDSANRTVFWNLPSPDERTTKTIIPQMENVIFMTQWDQSDMTTGDYAALGDYRIVAEVLDEEGETMARAEKTISLQPEPLPVTLAIETDKDVYLIGDVVNISIILTNPAEENLTLFNIPPLGVYNANGTLMWEPTKTLSGDRDFEFIDVDNLFTILPLSTQTLNATIWNQTDLYYHLPVPPGTYKVSFAISSFDGLTLRAEKEIAITGEYPDIFTPLYPSLEITTDKEVYEIGEEVNITAIFVNPTNVTIDYFNPSFALHNSAGNEVWTPISLDVVIEKTIFPYTEHTIISTQWDQRDYDGRQYPPDTYTIVPRLIGANGLDLVKAEKEFVITDSVFPTE